MAEADELQRRAIALRVIARTLDSAGVLTLYRRAGPDVWQGGTPQLCLDEVTAMRSSVIGAATELRRAARVLEQRAAAIPLVPAFPALPFGGSR